MATAKPYARYLTVGGAVVECTENGTRYVATCLGCTWSYPHGTAPASARAKANQHAHQCRAMPND
ncbi:hypothetical protein ACFUEM_38730 [Streptomyces anulatus]|uniref:hypothetical protein n=1 Tax=Streptomyces anulatus TaxID=1892 RepID=UPI0035DA186E